MAGNYLFYVQESLKEEPMGLGLLSVHPVVGSAGTWGMT